MTIPLFSGSVGSSVAPLTPPLESFDTTAFLRGAQAAESIPSTASAIAQGVEGAVKNYQLGRAGEQRIQANQLELDRAAALQPEEIAAEKAKLEEERASLADEAKVRQQRDELAQIFQSGDPQQKLDAVTSGRYALAFAKDKNLEEYAIKVTAPDMPDDVAHAFIKNDMDKQLRGMLLRNQQTLQNKASATEADLLSSEELDSILSQKGNERYGHNPIALTEKAVFVPQGTYEKNPDGTTKRDPNTGYPVQKTVYPDSTQKPLYQIVDKDTKQIIGENVTGATKSLFEKYNSARVQLQKGGFARPEISEIIRQARKRNEGITGRAPSQTQQVSAPVTPVPRISDANKAAPLESVEKVLEKTPLVSDSGQVVAKDNSALPVIFAQALGLPPEKASAVGKEFSELSSILHQEIEDITYSKKFDSLGNKLFSPQDLEAQRQEELDKAETKDAFLRKTLSEEFLHNKDVLEERYNDAAVKEHNDALDKWQAYRERPGAFGSAPGYTELAKINNIWKKVSSPEELYVESSLEVRGARFDALWDRAIRSGQGQLRSKANSPSTRAAIVDRLKVYK